MHVQHQAKCLGRTHTRFLRGVITPTRNDARLVVVTSKQTCPACILHGRLITGHNALELRQVKWQWLPFDAFAVKINVLE